MKHDYVWLEPYAHVLTDRKVLELGCGSGIDTKTIAAFTASVVSCDLNPSSEITSSTLMVDHSKPLPFADSSFDTCVASLCLHYFSLVKTREIIAEITRILKPEGYFIGRVNSDQDLNYGAEGCPEIEPNLYMVDGQQKRFFTEQAIQSLWAGAYLLKNIDHKNIDRYQKTKRIYEFSGVKI